MHRIGGTLASWSSHEIHNFDTLQAKKKFLHTEFTNMPNVLENKNLASGFTEVFQMWG